MHYHVKNEKNYRHYHANFFLICRSHFHSQFVNLQVIHGKQSHEILNCLHFALETFLLASFEHLLYTYSRESS